MPMLALTGVRAAAAAALAPRQDTDPPIHEEWVEGVDPPALMLEWSDPWLTPAVVARAGYYTAHLSVLCFAARVSPGLAVDTLEGLVSYVVGRLDADDHTWPFLTAQAPRRFDMSNLVLLAARLTFQVPVGIINGGT